MNTTKITNEQTGQTIELAKTNDIQMLKNQLMLLGMNGLFYSPWAIEIQEKIKKIKELQNSGGFSTTLQERI